MLLQFPCLFNEQPGNCLKPVLSWLIICRFESPVLVRQRVNGYNVDMRAKWLRNLQEEGPGVTAHYSAQHNDNQLAKKLQGALGVRDIELETQLR